MGIAGIAEASSPTGDVVARFCFSRGGWKPITANSLRRHSGSGLSGSPPSEPFSFPKRATRFSISLFDQLRTCRQPAMGFLVTFAILVNGP
ncbi:MAG: hypothetical protein A3D95_09770 [Betaproteobacteria bacterium RIFCSPHIGHO2_12_FULL_69_13]|nr:MAG: hypothetical protein A3D95_09770 [Betaproteobacteria bacterium RIFCSPHIGHO2_12_FULL_69_13]OGA64508.1 MAG: hypothetical protein A3G83_08605 [Betaproteobacteria bacterium RIFCSPLOWO2_12_FULL_68_20]